ncbi:MAG: amine oxidase [Frankiales bacterium]|nr:amine oxidase [Frankiales bacterium]
MLTPPRRVAVIGAGVSGLTAAYVLERAGTQVTLFEKDDRLGGHADTHEVLDGPGRTQRVDTGFIVHNERTYPVLLRLFAELGVETQESDMSMSVRCDGCGLEYAGAKGLTGLFAVRQSTSPRYLRMLAEIGRFHRRARGLLAGAASDQTLDAFLDEHRFSRYFRSHFMTPVVSCVWSCPPETAGRYPARYLFAFLAHHGMLAVTGSPQWRTVVGGSQSYVDLLAKEITAACTSSPVSRLRRTADRVEVLVDGETLSYDAAVVATHPHQALALLEDPTAAQRDVLSAISYTVNPTVLHTDRSLLPRSTRAQASWNYVMDRCASDASTVLVSYDMNRLQRLDADETFVVTLNGIDRVDPATVVATMDYEHPAYTPASVAAQRRLPELSDDRVAFAGAYHGWGFHEDGARSGVEAAQALGASW